VYDSGKLVHVGRVGTGFKDAVARSLRDQLESLKRSTSPFPNKLTADAVRGVRWVNLSLWRRWSCEAGRATACFGTPPTRGSETTRTQPRSFAKAQRVAPSLQPGDKPSTLPIPTGCCGPTSASRSRVWRSSTPTLQIGCCRTLSGDPWRSCAAHRGTASKCFFQKHAWEGMGDDIKCLAVDEGHMREVVAAEIQQRRPRRAVANGVLSLVEEVRHHPPDHARSAQDQSRRRAARGGDSGVGLGAYRVSSLLANKCLERPPKSARAAGGCFQPPDWRIET
jgi:ATP dependent DNA ligase C terminal region